MADYTRLTFDEINILMESYNLGALDSVSPMQGGQANSSFKLSTNQGYFILSVCDEKDVQQIDCLTQILSYLETKNFPTSRLVRTKDEKLFIARNDKPVYVKRYIEGEVCKFLSPRKLEHLGEIMAALHEVAPLSIMPKQFPYGIESFDGLFEIDVRHPYIDWIKQKKDFLEQSMDPEMDKGFVHGDLFWDNLLFSKDKLVAVLDFEEVCHYYKLFDLGMGAVGCCGEKGSFNMKKVMSLLNGYQRHSPLSHKERKQLKIFMEYAAVAVSFWRFQQYNIKHPNHNMAQSYLELSSLADHIHGMDEDEFMAIFSNTIIS